MPAILGLIGPAMSMGGGLMGMFGGGPSQNVQLPPMWQMPGMDQAAGGAMSGIQDLLRMNVPQQLMPAYGQVAGNLMNNPFQGMAMGGAGAASGYGAHAANMAAGSGDFLTQMGQGMAPYAMGVMNAGFDPQNALYGRMAHDTQERARAGNEARGLDMSPYGAGLENDASRNFNIDWQNNALQRMISGVGAGAGAMGAGGNMMNMGANLSAMAPGLAMQSGMFPYQTFNQIGGDQLSALNSLSQAGLTATQVPQQGVQNYMNYLGAGNQANQVQNQGGQMRLNQANDMFRQQQQFGQQFGQGMAGMTNGLGKMYGWGNQGGGSPGYYGGSPQTNPNLNWG